jgi:hypothetical protein
VCQCEEFETPAPRGTFGRKIRFAEKGGMEGEEDTSKVVIAEGAEGEEDGATQAEDVKSLKRRNRPGTKNADMYKWAPLSVSQLEGPLAVEEYLQQLIRTRPSNPLPPLHSIHDARFEWFLLIHEFN